MKIHKEGYGIIRRTVLVFVLLSLASVLWLPVCAWVPVVLLSLAAIAFTVRFFRVPTRERRVEEGAVFAPADGKIVAIEETREAEYLGEKRIQVSVFMSVWNVHINWFPVGGEVEYYKYHPGKFLVAWHPKSSEENERTTTVVRCGEVSILFRQIAGMVARRIVSYARVGERVEQNTQCGFIKFGSRVDLFLPLDSEICVGLHEKVTGSQTVIARLKKR